MLSITCKPLMLSVVMLNVITLSVVALITQVVYYRLYSLGIHMTCSDNLNEILGTLKTKD
jgi:hypothetical protein